MRGSIPYVPYECGAKFSKRSTNIEKEYEILTATRDASLTDDIVSVRDAASLKIINETLWQIEDDIQNCEREQGFGETFIDLARSVYQIYDWRAAVKWRLDEPLGSDLVEEKSYKPHD